MPIIEFPPVEDADEHGLLAIGGDLAVESLLLAYRSGIFPWPIEEGILTWFAPPRRGVLFVEDLHVTRSLRKSLRRNNFVQEIDKDFPRVLDNCARLVNRGKQKGTWITSDIKTAYVDFHRAGYAHSFETYQDGRLVGGLYGVSIGMMFAGESMFHEVSDASKAALLHLAEYLNERGVEWIDCQVLTPFLKSMGAIEVERDEFMDLLGRSLERKGQLF